ncbi:MAG: thioredoxin domain-containing protein [Candidatus Micrarchaeota archaeon]|nr:thioredoxin domain-containing protein [Candidatus Micrarchaeota archaeon]
MEAANRLAMERSPYLKEHSHDPVDWYPWGDEAFEAAKRLDRPIFLSIGYSSCHWCHVMQRESFQDEKTAKRMNELFVNMKVDREERPDIDAVYMKVCQLMNGNGGWPLTIIMTPDKRPFFSATYIPRSARFGDGGMDSLMDNVEALWSKRREDIEKTAMKVVDALEAHVETRSEPGKADPKGLIEEAFLQLSGIFDNTYGGFGTAPKFLMPAHLMFLLQYHASTGSDTALYMVERTLRMMRLGGVYDQIGFGFHRYSTDQMWFMPHFEKMLYDQALMSIVYTDAYLATKSEDLGSTAKELLQFMATELRSRDGAFYTALDADSNGREGEFYLWSAEEVKRLLPDKVAASVMEVFNLDEEGNFRDSHGKNILYMTASLEDISEKTENGDIARDIGQAREAMYMARSARIPPNLDDKILADNNGLAIAAFSKAARAFGNEGYLVIAKKAADRIISELFDGDRLLHARGARGPIYGFIDDYAFLCFGLIELYQASFEAKYLDCAIRLAEHMEGHFLDKGMAGFFTSADYAEGLLVRDIDTADGAIPSGNSVAMMDMIRLSRMTGDESHEEKASRIADSLHGRVSQYHLGYTFLLTALSYATSKSYEIVVAGERGAKDTETMLAAINSTFLPNAVVVLNDGSGSVRSDFAKGMKQTGGAATAYVCTGFSCKAPTNSVKRMIELLGKG